MSKATVRMRVAKDPWTIFNTTLDGGEFSDASDIIIQAIRAAGTLDGVVDEDVTIKVRFSE